MQEHIALGTKAAVLQGVRLTICIIMRYHISRTLSMGIDNYSLPVCNKGKIFILLTFTRRRPSVRPKLPSPDIVCRADEYGLGISTINTVATIHSIHGILTGKSDHNEWRGETVGTDFDGGI